MSTRQGTITYQSDGSFDAVWTGITESDSGTPISIPNMVVDLSMQVVGDFTTSGAISLEGSNDGSAYAVLDDVGGTPVVATASSKIWRFANQPKYIKPVATAGSSVSMDVYIHGARL